MPKKPRPFLTVGNNENSLIIFYMDYYCSSWGIWGRKIDSLPFRNSKIHLWWSRDTPRATPIRNRWKINENSKLFYESCLLLFSIIFRPKIDSCDFVALTCFRDDLDTHLVPRPYYAIVGKCKNSKIASESWLLLFSIIFRPKNQFLGILSLPNVSVMM